MVLRGDPFYRFLLAKNDCYDDVKGKIERALEKVD
jgi:hypothetical protein